MSDYRRGMWVGWIIGMVGANIGFLVVQWWSR